MAAARCAPVLLLLRDGVVVSAGGACNGGGIHDGDSWRLVLIIASMVVHSTGSSVGPTGDFYIAG